MNNTFYNCTSLTTVTTISNNVTNMEGTFYNCTSLTTAPAIPNNVTNMEGTFYNCTSLTTAPTIPNSVTNMGSTFGGCKSLTGTIEINANPTDYTGCFLDTEKPITLTGSSTILNEIAQESFNGNVTIK